MRDENLPGAGETRTGISRAASGDGMLVATFAADAFSVFTAWLLGAVQRVPGCVCPARVVLHVAGCCGGVDVVVRHGCARYAAAGARWLASGTARLCAGG